MDRQTFLANLLESKNVVRLGKGWSYCSICRENFGDQSDGIEEPEVQVYLPCHKTHTMGSHCITKWLEHNNTCPICRHELFPAEVTELDEDEEFYRFADYYGYEETDHEYSPYPEIQSFYDLPAGEHSIVTADALERTNAEDIMTGINRFPVWRARRSRETPRPIEPRRRQRNVASPAQRRCVATKANCSQCTYKAHAGFQTCGIAAHRRQDPQYSSREALRPSELRSAQGRQRDFASPAQRQRRQLRSARRCRQRDFTSPAQRRRR